MVVCLLRLAETGWIGRKVPVPAEHSIVRKEPISDWEQKWIQCRLLLAQVETKLRCFFETDVADTFRPSEETNLGFHGPCE